MKNEGLELSIRRKTLIVRPQELLGWSRVGALHPAHDPLLEAGIVQGRVVDVQPSAHGLASHLHRADPRQSEKRIAVVWIDVDKKASSPAGGDRHVAVNEERQAAEHLPLGESRLPLHHSPDPVGKGFVVRH